MAVKYTTKVGYINISVQQDYNYNSSTSPFGVHKLNIHTNRSHFGIYIEDENNNLICSKYPGGEILSLNRDWSETFIYALIGAQSLDGYLGIITVTVEEIL